MTGDYKIQSFVTLQRKGDHQGSFRAETPLITNTRAPPCHDPHILPPYYTNKHIHKHIHTSSPTSCATHPIKLTPTIPLLEHAVLCQQALVSSKQRNQKCKGFQRHGWGLLIPSYWCFLSFFPSFFFLCPQSSKRKNCNFFS